MEILNQEKVRREGLPSGAHLVELVRDPTECALHPHFAGMDCVPVANLEMVRERFRTQEPILIHCEQVESCDLAAVELDRMGYKNVFRYEGRLEDLEPLMGEYRAPVASRDDVEGLLKARAEKVHLINIVPDISQCPTLMVGVTCLEPANFREEGLKDLNRDDTIVLRCETGLDCQTMARTAREAGFSDVRIFEGDYKDIRWLERM